MNMLIRIFLVVLSVSTLGLVVGVTAEAADTELPVVENPQVCEMGRGATGMPCGRWYYMSEKEHPDACLNRPGEQPCGRWFSVPAPAPTVITLSDVHFDFDSAQIKPDSLHNLDDDVETLKKHETAKVTIIGHTDAIGTEQYNEQLSQRRAESVMEYFIQQGISPSRMAAEGRGDTQPVANNDTEQGRAENRRTELYLD